MMSSHWDWNSTSKKPLDGESIFVIVQEWCGGYHVDYGVVHYDTDGVLLRRYENDEWEQWPPEDVHGWKVCKMPDVAHIAKG